MLRLSGMHYRKLKSSSNGGGRWGCLRSTTLPLRPHNKNLQLEDCSEGKTTVVCTTTNIERNGTEARIFS